jgi:hypothetical protein
MFLSLHAMEVMGQDLTFSYQASFGSTVAAPNQFGILDAADQGLDDFDLPQPPPDPQGSFNTYLAMSGASTVFPNRWLRDFRPPTVLLDRVELWSTTLEGIDVGVEVRVAIEALDPQSLPYKLFVFGPGMTRKELVLPGEFTFTTAASPQLLFWELQMDDSVATDPETWGGIKSLYH